jgi:hypothetical protein
VVAFAVIKKNSKKIPISPENKTLHYILVLAGSDSRKKH